MTQPTVPEPGPRYDTSNATTNASPGGTAKKPERASWFEDFIDIFYAPSTVFARREGSGFWIPLLVVSLLIGVVFLVNADVMEPIVEAEFDRGMAKARAENPQLTSEQIDQMRGFAATGAKIFAFVGTPILIMAIGTILWLVGKFFDARQTLGAAVMVAAYSYMPRVVEQIINRAQALVIDPAELDHQFSLSLGLGRFLDPDTTAPVLRVLAGRIDVFTIWVTVLLAIGLAVTGKVGRRSAATAGVVMWVIGALPGVAGALRQ